MMQAVRERFVFGMHLVWDQVAFSQPTQLGTYLGCSLQSDKNECSNDQAGNGQEMLVYIEN